MKSSSDNAVSGISVKYIYSACVVTRTPNVRVLHDPWFTDGVYDGSWSDWGRPSARPVVTN